MAALQKRNGSYRIIFQYLGKQHAFTIGKVTEREAENWAAQVDQILLRLDQQFLTLPPRVNIVAFVKNGGKLPEIVQAAQESRKPISLKKLREKYLETHKQAMEASSLATIEIHLKHLEQILGSNFPVHELKLDNLQQYVNKREATKFRGRLLSSVTVKKEIVSLRAAWNWAVHMGFVSGPFPDKGLVFGKYEEKPPFMTGAEIDRKVIHLSKAQTAELWDCLFLTKQRSMSFCSLSNTTPTNRGSIQPFVLPLKRERGGVRLSVLNSKIWTKSM